MAIYQRHMRFRLPSRNTHDERFVLFNARDHLIGAKDLLSTVKKAAIALLNGHSLFCKSSLSRTWPADLPLMTNVGVALLNLFKNIYFFNRLFVSTGRCLEEKQIRAQLLRKRMRRNPEKIKGTCVSTTRVIDTAVR